MNLRNTSARLMLTGAMLISTGCVAQSPPRGMAQQGGPPPGGAPHHKAQLIAAARQYEKENRPDLATRYYRQVLAMDPQNAEAKLGLELVQSGKLRQEAGYDEIVAAAHPNGRPQLRTREELEKRKSELDARTAELVAVAEAAARAAVKETLKASQPADVQVSAVRRAPSKPVETEQAIVSAAAATSEELEAATVSAITPVSSVSAAVDADLPGRRALDATPAVHSEPARDVETAAATTSPISLTRLCQDANAAILREVAKLDSADSHVRNDGLQALAHMGRDASSAALAVRALLQDNVDLVRAHAAWAVWEITGDRTVIDSLAALLRSPNADVVQFTAYTLARIGEPAAGAVPVLCELLKSSHPRVRVHAAEAIAHIAPSASQRDDAVEFLILSTADPSAEVRTLALIALGTACKSLTVPVATTLSSALHDNDAEVRATAALTLGGFGPSAKSTIAQLEFVAQNDSPDVKQAAAMALECIRR